MTRRVQIVDVAPRDGLQSEAVVLPTETKIELIDRLVEAGIRRVETVSFARPDRVPQMADAEAVMDGLPRKDGVRYAALSSTSAALDRAVGARVDEINVVVVATDTFSGRNQNTTTEGALAAWSAVAGKAAAAGIRGRSPSPAASAARTRVRCRSSAWCEWPPQPPRRARRSSPWPTRSASPCRADVVERVPPCGMPSATCRSGATSTTPATPGWPTRTPPSRQASACSTPASVESAAARSCPGGPGNIPTEDLAYMLERAGVETGVSLERLIAAAEWLGEQLARAVPGLLSWAGPFPSPRISTVRE